MTGTRGQMIVDESGSLHVRVTDRRSYEPESQRPQRLAHRVGLLRLRGNLTEIPPPIHLRSPADETPDESIEGPELCLNGHERPCIRNRRFDLHSITDDSRVRQEGAHFPRVVSGYLLHLEPVERPSVVLPFA